MNSCVVTDAATKSSVGMGQILLAQAPGQLNTVLGSCVGIVLYHEVSKLGAVAHVVLPNDNGRDGAPGKFANKVIPHMLKLLRQEGAGRDELTVKIAGGANMFGSPNGPMQIGQQNIEAVREAIEKEKLRISAEHLGGSKGRRITLDCFTGEVTVQRADFDLIVI